MTRSTAPVRWQLVAVVAVFAALAAGAAWWITDLAMAPTGSERVGIIVLFAAFAAGTVVLAGALQWFTAGSLDRRILTTAVIGPVLVAVATLFGAQSMFISSHDTQFVIVLVLLATALAVIIVQMLARPLLRDLDTIRSVADAVGQGDLSRRADLDRTDQVGDLSQSLDAMIDRLADAEHERDLADRERSVMLASLGHDARTPLAAMRAAIEAIQDGVSPDPERYLRSIEHDLGAVEDIVDNIFFLGRIEAGRVEPSIEVLDMEGAAATCIEALTPLAQKHEVDLVLDSCGPAPGCAGRTELSRVLQNLIANGIRHSPPGEPVTVRVESAEPRSSTISVTVTDRGPGFDEDFVDQAFEAFARRDDDARTRADGGAGLGLAVARGLLDAMGGSIEARPGPGGHVRIAVPAPASS